MLKRQCYKLFANFFSLNKTNIQAPDKQAKTVIQIPLSGLIYSFNYRQDAGIRTREAAAATRCAANELHTFFNKMIFSISDSELDFKLSDRR